MRKHRRSESLRTKLRKSPSLAAEDLDVYLKRELGVRLLACAPAHDGNGTLALVSQRPDGPSRTSQPGG